MRACRQLGIGNFEPLKPVFLEVFSGAQAALPGLPGTGALALPLGRGWSSADERKSPAAPALVRMIMPCPAAGYHTQMTSHCGSAWQRRRAQVAHCARPGARACAPLGATKL